MTSSSDPVDSETPIESSGAVHTSRTPTAADTQRVGVLSLHNSKETKAILNAVEMIGHDPVWIREENVSSWIVDGEIRLSPRVDVLVNRMLLTKSDHQLEDIQLAAIYEETTPIINPPQAVVNTLHKYRAGMKLAAADLPVPDAYFARSPRTFENWSEHLSDDATHKHTIGTNGQQMSIISPTESVSPMINDEYSFAQEFLEEPDSHPSDVRVYVIGGEIVGAMRRHAPAGDWRTNVAVGGEVEGVTDELDEEARDIAIRATNVLGLDMAGVDMMSINGEWYLLEMNATAGFKGMFSATGVSVAPFIARLAIERAGGDVAEETVAELKATLDDSVPECKPPLTEENDSNDILGYTNRIRVNGRDGAEEIIAKSDTGAKRTSIDTKLAGRIGAGPLVGTTNVRSSTGSGTETRPLVDVSLCLNNCWRTVTASITDRSDMEYPILLGRDVLESYKLDISRTVEE